VASEAQGHPNWALVCLLISLANAAARGLTLISSRFPTATCRPIRASMHEGFGTHDALFSSSKLDH